MIVRNEPDGSVILINQTDHARLSGYLAAHWGNDRFAVPAPRESMIRAASQHDIGWIDYETLPRYDASAKTTPNFMQVPLDPAQIDASRNGINWLTHLDPYAGLQVSRHRTGLWRARYGSVEVPPATTRPQTQLVEDFIAELEAAQEAAFAKLDRKAFETNYALLQFWDLMSLYLCTKDPVPAEMAIVPSSYTGDGVRMTFTPQGNDTIKLDPYPFDIQNLTARYVFRRLPTLDFADEAAFRLAYFAAPYEIKTYSFI